MELLARPSPQRRRDHRERTEIFKSGHCRKIVLLLIAITMALQVYEISAAAKHDRTLSSVIYFTNNTPPNVDQFPVELFTRNPKRRVVSTRPNDKSKFRLTGLEARQYLLKVTWPGRCVLWYRVNLTKQSRLDARIIMDVECAHRNGAIQDLQEN
jgi:hypothetical protein